jgi:hypothetical protein
LSLRRGAEEREAARLGRTDWEQLNASIERNILLLRELISLFFAACLFRF